MEAQSTLFTAHDIDSNQTIVMTCKIEATQAQGREAELEVQHVHEIYFQSDDVGEMAMQNCLQ